VKSFADSKLNAALVVILERWGLLWRGSSGSDDPVGDDGGEASGEGDLSLVGSCSAFEMTEI
jgi:hypothetical protein